ncbi:hypothetical protein J4402_01035 [Candidatus Pacearchaeota archaeon]|nr:hypothetical protein [Candidatus Pacearchaeota archaeon]
MKKSGQIWIETVLYTLIGLALIGISLAIITPRINAARDKLLVEQTIESLGILDGKIDEVARNGHGNKRVVEEFIMKKGEMYINTNENKIIFNLTGLSKPYSEPGASINKSRVEIISWNTKKGAVASLTLNYKNIVIIDTEDSGANEIKKFNAAATPYRFSIENMGKNPPDTLERIRIEETSGR